MTHQQFDTISELDLSTATGGLRPEGDTPRPSNAENNTHHHPHLPNAVNNTHHHPHRPNRS